MNVFDFNREEFLKKIQQIKNGICVELGVFKGEYSAQILKNNPKILYMIDIWASVEKGYDDDRNNKYHPNAYIEAFKISNLFPNKNVIIKAESEEASKLFQENSIEII